MVTIKDRDQLVINQVVSQKATEIKGFPFIQDLENTTKTARSDNDTITESKVAVKCRAATSARPPGAAKR